MLYLINNITKQKKYKQKQRGYLFLYSLIPLFLYSFIPLASIAQVLTNNGAQIYSNTGAIIFVDGEALNQNSGTFDNNGTIEVTGNWTNNAGNAAFINSSPGTVLMSGAAQNIQGSDVTQFYDLTLSGTGIKSQNIDAVVENTLNLNDRELATQQYTMYVINPSVNAITRTGSTSPPYSNNTNEGFVSSDSIAGTLSRVTNSTSTYLFPVGSSSGTVRFRPVEITPNAAVIDTFTSRMANVDATTEGFDRNNKDSTLCIINPVYYHNINNIPGNSADITIYFDDVLDNNYMDIAHWQNVPRWENTGAVTVVSNGSPVLSSVTKSAWNDYSYTPFALGMALPLVTLTSNDTTICPGDNITFTASAGFFNYDFYNNSGLVQSDTLNTYTTGALTTGDTIRVSAFSSGCTAYSNEIIITVQIEITGSNAPSDETLCPVNGKFTLPKAEPAGGSWDGPGIVDASTGEVETSTLTIGLTYDYIYTNQGCPDTMRVTICEEYEYFIPEIFSPNNDGINDILYVRGKGIDWILLRIYDRWGEMVFESNNIDKGWDGKFRDKQMNAGVFVYVLEITFLNDETDEEHGDITLVR